MTRRRRRRKPAAKSGADRRAVFLAVVVAVLVVAVAVARLLGDTPGASASCDEPVPWHAAAGHVGEVAAVEGPVAAVSYVPEVGGEPTFLNLGNAHPAPSRFDVVVYGDVRERFDPPPEQQFAGETVCVVGRVRDRDGVPQIIIDAPAQVHVPG